MSVMSAFLGSAGSSSPENVPLIRSYGGVSGTPCAAGEDGSTRSTLTISMRVTRASAVTAEQTRTKATDANTLLTISRPPGGARIACASRSAASRRLDERAVAQVLHRLLQFRLRIHHDRPVPRHRLLDRPARYQEKTDALVT